MVPARMVGDKIEDDPDAAGVGLAKEVGEVAEISVDRCDGVIVLGIIAVLVARA